MTPTSSDIDWPALLALEGQATAGPWWEDVGDEVTSVESKYQTVACDVTNADAAFIAASRTAVPALVELVRGLAGAVEEAREMVELWASYADGYYKEKHGLAGDLEQLRAALATIPAALRAGVGDGE